VPVDRLGRSAGEKGTAVKIPLWFASKQATMLSVLLVTPSGWLNAPVVVLTRGNNSPRVDGHDLEIADSLAGRGIASVLLDFAAQGYPAGPLDQSTLNRPIEDLGSTFDALRLQRGIDVGKIGVAGSAVGGTIALLRASFDPRIHALALRSTLAPTTELPTAAIAAPTLLIAGKADATRVAAAKTIAGWLSGPHELRLIDRAGRDFTEPGAWDTVLAGTVAWFVEYLGTGVRIPAA
jgi:dienelactone hydrolase